MSASEMFQCSRCDTQIPECNRHVHPLTCTTRSPSSSLPPPSSSLPPPSSSSPPPSSSSPPPSSSPPSSSLPPLSSPSPPPSPRSSTSESAAECEYCNVLISLSTLDDHSTTCGATTIMCRQCDHRVRRRDLTIHLQSNCAVYATTSRPSQNPEPRRILPRLARDASHPSGASTWAPVAAAGAVGVALTAISYLRRR